MIVDKILYRIPAKEVDFKNMPNDEEFYFVIDLVGCKRVHRCGHIKAHPNNFKYVLLDKTQLKDEQLRALTTAELDKLNKINDELRERLSFANDRIIGLTKTLNDKAPF